MTFISRVPARPLASHRSLRRLASGWLFALVLAPLLWQTLGQVHRVVHAPGLHATGMVTAAPVAGVAMLGGHAADDGLCRLLDQLGSGHGLGASAWVLPPAVWAAGVALATGLAWPQAAPLAFEARGPPFLR